MSQLVKVFHEPGCHTDACLQQGLDSLNQSHLQGQGDLVSSLLAPMTHIVTLVIPIIRVVVKIMVPFWIPIIIRHLIFRGPKKGPYFDNHP